MQYLHLIILDFFMNLLPQSQKPFELERNSIQSKIIVHALGEYNGEKYLNSLEAFEASYGKGHKVFEVDFFHTSDDKIVLFHDGHEERFGLNKGFTEKEFLASTKLGTPLNLEAFGKLLNKYSDVRIITDVKDDNYKALKTIESELSRMGIAVSERIIPQVYNPYEFEDIKTLSFKNYIFTDYRFKKKYKEVTRFLKKYPQISALTIPVKRVGQEYKNLAKECRIDVYVHTINSADKAKEVLSWGAQGVYSDSLVSIP